MPENINSITLFELKREGTSDEFFEEPDRSRDFLHYPVAANLFWADAFV